MYIVYILYERDIEFISITDDKNMALSDMITHKIEFIENITIHYTPRAIFPGLGIHFNDGKFREDAKKSKTVINQIFDIIVSNTSLNNTKVIDINIKEFNKK